MPVTCLPSSLPLSSPLSPPPSPLSPPPSPRLPPEREDGGEESYLYMEAPEYLYMPPLYLHMEELDEQDEAESLRMKGLEHEPLDPTFANVGVSESSHRTLCRSLVTLG